MEEAFEEMSKGLFDSNVGEIFAGKLGNQTPCKLNEQLLFLVLQFCKEEKLDETAHVLERETAVFFDLNHFESLVTSGQWDEVERYLSGYGSLEDDNKYLRKVYFEVRKQKLFEALDMGDRAKALDIVRKELKPFASYNEELFKEITQLLTLDDFREHDLLNAYGDIYSARRRLSEELKRIIEADPSFYGKLEFPTIGMSRLRRLVNQSLNWQHLSCKNPKSHPDISTLFKDHVCEPLLHSDQSNLEPLQAVDTTSCGECKSDLLSVKHAAVLGSVLQDYSVNSAVTSDEVQGTTEANLTATLQEADSSSLGQSKLVDLPDTIACELVEDSVPTTMDFHPVNEFILLVGTDVGEIALWDILSRKKLYSKSCNIYDVGTCTVIFKTAFVKDQRVLVKHAAWSEDGAMFGVAYSQSIVQLFTYRGGISVLPSLEISAHTGSVNDIAFAKPDKDIVVITCGDDKLVKVWDASTGANRYVFDNHGAAVTSVTPLQINGSHLIFSTSTNGEMRGWTYDNLGYRIAVNDPCCRRMVYAKSGKRIFSCGMNGEEKLCILEWDNVKGSVKRQYQGLKKPLPGVVHFDTSNDKILAAGDDHVIKFWNMSNSDLLLSTDVGGKLPVYPYLRFSKEGMFLAISAKNNTIVILTTPSGLELLKCRQKHLCESFSVPTVNKPITDSNNYPEVYTRVLLDNDKSGKICKLVYTNDGTSIVALTSAGVHLVWKWPKCNSKSEGIEGTSPQLWRPRNGLLMTNISSHKPDIAKPCFALSKNGSYLISTSGGEFSLFNMLTFKRITTFLPSEPPTAVALYPKDNNIIAIAGEDFTIVIYNIRANESKCRLRGHSKCIMDLAFSTKLNKLISIGADAKIVAWDSERWEKLGSANLPDQTGAMIQFHRDQVHFLTIQDTRLAIYEAKELECEKQMYFEKTNPVSHATFSCDGKMIYTCFHDASVSIFHAWDLRLIASITPNAYLPHDYIRQDVATDNDVCPRVIACHPERTSQFAMGLENGTVVILEPREPLSSWCSTAGV